MGRTTIGSLMRSARGVARDATVGKAMRRKLQVDHVTIVASDCTGGCLYHDLGLRFDSPFINMFLPAADYVRVVSDLDGYLSQPLVESANERGFKYPVALLGDAHVHLVHYDNVLEAKRKWDERIERFDYKRPVFVMNDRNGYTTDDGIRFASVVGMHGVLFTHIDNGLGRVVHEMVVPGASQSKHVPIMTGYTPVVSVRRRYDLFDFVSWINERLVD